MNVRTQIRRGIAMTAAYTAFLCWLFSVSILENGCTYMGFHPVVFLAFYVMVYCLNVLMVKKDLNLALYVGFQLLMCAASVALFLFTAQMEPFHVGTVIFMGIFSVGGVLACAYGAAEPILPKNLIFYFDAIGVLMVLMLVLCEILPLFFVGETLLLSFLAMGLSMISLVSARTEQADTPRPRTGGRLLVTLLVVVIVAVAALLVTISATGVQSFSEVMVYGAKQGFQAIRSVGLFLMDKLEQFLTWLIQFLPKDNFDTLEDAAAASVEGSVPATSRVQLPDYFYYIGTAILAFLLVRFLLSMRKERVGEEFSIAPAPRELPRTGTLRSGLREMFRTLWVFLRFQVNRIRYRRTPQGLLLLCESRVPKTLRRRPDESGPAFLRRIAETAQTPEQRDALHSLSTLTQQALYSTTHATVPDELYRAVKKCRF